jgi:hypothetical protein
MGLRRRRRSEYRHILALFFRLNDIIAFWGSRECRIRDSGVRGAYGDPLIENHLAHRLTTDHFHLG